MRLTCPNCGAQYEVPDAVIPAAGRDVQCSNCGDTWFQDHPGGAPAAAAAPAPRVAPRRPSRPEELAAEGAGRSSTDIPAPEEQPPAPVQQALQDGPAEEPDEDEWQSPEAEDEDQEEAPVPEAPRRRELDPSIKEVLRQEAEHEARVRAQEGGLLESQPDLGLTEPEPATETESSADRRERESRARMARLRGDKAEPQPEGNGISRRDLLPDIEEINSSLRSRGQKAEPEESYDVPDPEARRSFRRGFTLPIFLAAIAVLLYVNAPRIAERFPQSEPAMRSYVVTVDEGRVWLDLNARRLITWIEEKTEA